MADIYYKDYMIRGYFHIFRVYSVTGAMMTTRSFSSVELAKKYIDDEIYHGR